MDIVREPPTALSENTLRHIMQLISLGTGLNVPQPLSLRYREKSLKEGTAHSSTSTPPRLRHRFRILGQKISQRRQENGFRILGQKEWVQSSWVKEWALSSWVKEWALNSWAREWVQSSWVKEWALNSWARG
ncbi:hypothetical protein CEXT_540291 [Caerostris extrusa]|uniref:Uncharacterized protein n=1 Tax=Caerostris extrusa TaxID=172846 RepID=A0AAV4Y6H9_CAEEX|nr:hypothetical protein CEXT_540291 [Caerostris extrusa]